MRTIVIFMLLFTGCAPWQGSGGGGPYGGDSERSSGQVHFGQGRALKVTCAQPEKLRGLNSVVITPPVLWGDVFECASALNLHRELQKAFQEELGVEVLDAKAVASVLRGMKEREPELMALDAGKKLGADTVLFSRISECRTLKGSEIGSESPAEIGFTIAALGVNDGRTLWRADYDLRDQALTDNLLKIKEKFKGRSIKWKTTLELFRQGFRAAAKDLSRRRTAQFSTH